MSRKKFRELYKQFLKGSVDEETAINLIESSNIDPNIPKTELRSSAGKKLLNNAAKMLCEYYNRLDLSYNQKKEIELDKISDKDNDWTKYEKKVIIGLKDYLEEFTENIIIHGSYGDGKIERGYSDLDTVIILSKDAFQNADQLLKTREKIIKSEYFLKRIDALQHHSHMIITQKELKKYPEHFLPSKVYQKSGVGLQKQKIKLNPVWKQKEMEKKFKDLSKNLESNLDSPAKWPSEKKSRLSILMLLPTLYLQAKGKDIYKAESFKIAKKEFKPEIWEPIEEASEIRQKWPVIRCARISPYLFTRSKPYYPKMYNNLKYHTIRSEMSLNSKSLNKSKKLVQNMRNNIS